MRHGRDPTLQVIPAQAGTQDSPRGNPILEILFSQRENRGKARICLGFLRFTRAEFPRCLGQLAWVHVLKDARTPFDVDLSRPDPCKIEIDQILRYSYHYGPEIPEVDGFTNYLHATDCPGQPRVLMEKGISPTATIKAVDGSRRGVIVVASSPHRVGYSMTPWHDIFDVDNGHIRYFGDAKTPGADPAEAPGNKALIEAHNVHSTFDAEERRRATPLVFFQRRTVNGVPKGFAAFQGFGVIERVERITQFEARKGRSFSNFVYDFAVLSMAGESELFDWSWINRRRDPACSVGETLKCAPASWRKWIAEGSSALPRVRRNVAKLLVTKAKDQMPPPGSRYDRTLKEICTYYATKRHRFEGLAYAIARRLLSSSGRRFVEGWITPSSGDGGADFIGRVDIGVGFGAVRQIVYGQAKCVSPTSGVDGKDIARTVARLKRGWFGVFVTTSYFSEPVQREVIEDEYPILLVSGLTVAEHAFQLVEEGGFASLRSYLDHLDEEFPAMVTRRRPEEILHV